MKDNISGGALTETSLLILLGFYNSSYGYEVMQWIIEVTNNRVQLGMGTLYGAMNSMEEKRWIKEEKMEGRRKFYKITKEGISQIENEILRMTELVILAKNTVNLKEKNNEKI